MNVRGKNKKRKPKPKKKKKAQNRQFEKGTLADAYVIRMASKIRELIDSENMKRRARLF